jgi:hypothetical protein
MLTLYDAAHADALARARELAFTAKPGIKVMILLPQIDRVFARAEDEEQNQLDALIEAASERRHVLVIGTACGIEPDGELDNLFGIKLLMPGVRPQEHRAPAQDPDALAYHRAVAEFYTRRAAEMGAVYRDCQQEGCIERILQVVSNPAEIEDIVNLALSTALHRAMSAQGPPVLDPEVLERAIRRVVVGRVVPASGTASATSD